MAFEGMRLDLPGPLRVRRSASTSLTRKGRRGYGRHTVSLDGPIAATEGVTIETCRLPGLKTPGWTIVPSALNMEPALSNRSLMSGVEVHDPKARCTTSVRAGEFLICACPPAPLMRGS